MKIKNQPIIAKATMTPGYIVRTRLDRICLRVGYEHDVYIPLKDYKELLVVSEKLEKELDKRIIKLKEREQRLALYE